MGNKVNRQIFSVSGLPRRLDRALEECCPELGLRGRRRLIASHAVLVNGRSRGASFCVREGDVIELAGSNTLLHEHVLSHAAIENVFPRGAEWFSPDGSISYGQADCVQQEETVAPDVPYLLGEEGGYHFLYKPSALHTVALAGGGGLSLEALLPSLLPQGKNFSLLQRLDFFTSGIVAAGNVDTVSHWKSLEAAGKCEKRYLALLEGEMRQACTATMHLDTSKRQRSRIVATEEASVLRHTHVIPLAVSACGLTLALCGIRRGARHQIRAHAAAMGYPLYGDAHYGGEGERFFLHHGALLLPECSCTCLPPWLGFLPEDLVYYCKKILNDPGMLI